MLRLETGRQTVSRKTEARCSPVPRNWLLAARPRRASPRDQPRPALVREVAVRPLDQHAGAIAEAGEIHDVEEEPEPPREATRDLQPADVRDRSIAADRREVALVAVDERDAIALLEV